MWASKAVCDTKGGVRGNKESAYFLGVQFNLYFTESYGLPTQRFG